MIKERLMRVPLRQFMKHKVYALPLPKEWQTANIASLEMINILVALKVWHLQWAGHRVLIHCDNQAVVSVLNTGKSRNDFFK